MSLSASHSTPDVIDDRYRIDEAIGHGGYCEVLAATDRSDERSVAIKWLHPEATQSDPRAADRLRQEAEILRTIDHPNVVRFIDTGHTDKGLYLVMERAPGQRLDHLIDRQGPLDSQVVVALMVQLLDALAAAHDGGILHRDLKPANLLIDGLSAPHLTLVDFGIAKADDLLNPEDPDGGITLVRTQAGNFVGTPQYAAPEMVVGDPAEPASDLFCAGLIAYEALCAEPLLKGTTQRQLINELIVPHPFDLDGLPLPWTAWLENVLEKAPDRRPPTARQALQQLYRHFPDAPPAPTLGGPAQLGLPEDPLHDDATTDFYAPIGAEEQAPQEELELDEDVLRANRDRIRQSATPSRPSPSSLEPDVPATQGPRELQEHPQDGLSTTQTLLIFSIIALLTFLAAGLFLF